jgi:hypothetical protein
MSMWKCACWPLALVPLAAFAQQPLTADEIMARVAANQDKAVELRAHYVYKQHTHTASLKTNGKLMREETDDYDVFPTPKGVDRKLVTLTGRYWHKGKYIDFHGEPIPEEGSMDADLTHDWMHDQDQKTTRDGVQSRLFPLTTKNQKDYEFRLIGEEMMRGRPVYHIGFAPEDKKEYDWKGEAFIDKTEFQPITVFTKLSRQLPFFVRGVMGVDVPGVGFNVTYVRVEEGVWFPETFGTEFELHLFHMFSRTVTVALKNSDFQKTHVDTKIDTSPSTSAPTSPEAPHP